ncbi:jerky protein homolog-like [Anthonomus grandis grandis]|uniref:jerky protein homolog-like n=1 Tax=Anthonomus grandis grandis TaxID=2921223 RepID=UPI002166078F|nr:jerky protein homolog-like [Anthonomus grandis grandis]
MTAGIFKEWFKEMFVPERKHFTPSHPPVEELLSDDGLIQVMYMPPNVTPLIQPMDQNVIRLTKLHYRSMFLAMVVANKSKDMNLVVGWSWKHIFESQSNDDREDTIPLATLRQELLSLNSIVETNLNLLEEIDPGQDFERGDIEEWNKDDFVEHDENCPAVSNDSETEQHQDPEVSQAMDKVTHVEAVRIFNRGLEWAEQNNADFEDI